MSTCSCEAQPAWDESAAQSLLPGLQKPAVVRAGGTKRQMSQLKQLTSVGKVTRDVALRPGQRNFVYLQDTI